MLRLLKRNRLLAGLAIAAAIAAAFCLAFHFDLLYGLQQQSGDLLFPVANLYQEKMPEGKIVIVGIDDKSLAQLGHFARWSRAHYARLIDTLAEAEARVIVFDILFSEPASGDEELATSIKNAGNVVLPVILAPTVTDSTVLRQSTQSKGFIKPLPIFESGAVARGHANVMPDADGVVRRLSLVMGDDHEPALALAAVAKYLRRPEVMESPLRDRVLPFAGREIPINENREMIINYISNPRGAGEIVNFRTISFVDVLNAEVDSSVFEDRIVLIGSEASGLGDTFWTPMGLMMNGVEIHASAIHTILSGNFLKPAPVMVTILAILASALLCGLLTLRLRMLQATLSAASLIVIYFLVAFYFFDHGVLLNMLYPPLTIVGSFVGINLYNVIVERSEKREVTDTFGRYVSPSVVDKILATLRESELKLGGEEHEITVAFADIRGFTSISEKMPPGELVTTLNIYLSTVIKEVLEYGGMINKFGGDSIMAIWNVPVECKEHGLSAVKAAVSIQRAIGELQEKGRPIVRMEFGIGINTGEAITGNMGSEDRLEYSVIGDAVNTAFRLASAAPGGKIWIGASTFALVRDFIVAEVLEPLAVKGKREPVQAYEVTGLRSSLSAGREN
jgi:adenylate cyclase